MLARLLERIGQGGMLSVAELARQLELSEALLELMISDLVRLGYLHPVDTCARVECSGCSLTRGCLRDGMKMWILAER